MGVGGQANGGALYSESAVIMSASTINGGSAIAGTGSSNGNGNGGGIYNVSDLSLYSCTIAGNSAIGSTFDSGGGIYDQGTLGITNCTIAANQADYGGGLFGFSTQPHWPVRAKNMTLSRTGPFPNKTSMPPDLAFWASRRWARSELQSVRGCGWLAALDGLLDADYC